METKIIVGKEYVKVDYKINDYINLATNSLYDKILKTQINNMKINNEVFNNTPPLTVSHTKAYK